MSKSIARNSFILHLDSLVILDEMTNEQAGIFLKSIKQYQITKKLPELDFGLKMAITPFINQFIRDEENYKKTCEARRLAGGKGGKQKVANASKSKQRVANLADSDSKSDSDNDSKNKNDSKSDSKNKNFTSSILEEITIPDFIDEKLWNSFLEMRVSKKAKPTQTAIELIIKELTKFHNKGLNANQSLENSIKSNWTGVFEPRNNNQTQFLTPDQRRRQNNLNASAEFLRLTSGDDNAGQ